MMSTGMMSLPMVALAVAVHFLTMTSVASLPSLYALDGFNGMNVGASGGQAGAEDAATAVAEAMLKTLQDRAERPITDLLKGTVGGVPRVVVQQPNAWYRAPIVADNGENMGLGHPIPVGDAVERAPGRQRRRLTANINGRGVMPTSNHGSIAGFREFLEALKAVATAPESGETPVQVFTRSQRARPVRACGGNLLIILENTCMASEEYGIKRSLNGEVAEDSSNDLTEEWAATMKPVTVAKKDEPQTLSLVEACCYRPCSKATLLNYCHHIY